MASYLPVLDLAIKGITDLCNKILSLLEYNNCGKTELTCVRYANQLKLVIEDIERDKIAFGRYFMDAVQRSGYEIADAERLLKESGKFIAERLLRTLEPLYHILKAASPYDNELEECYSGILGSNMGTASLTAGVVLRSLIAYQYPSEPLPSYMYTGLQGLSAAVASFTFMVLFDIDTKTSELSPTKKELSQHFQFAIQGFKNILSNSSLSQQQADDMFVIITENLKARMLSLTSETSLLRDFNRKWILSNTFANEIAQMEAANPVRVLLVRVQGGHEFKRIRTEAKTMKQLRSDLTKAYGLRVKRITKNIVCEYWDCNVEWPALTEFDLRCLPNEAKLEFEGSPLIAKPSKVLCEVENPFPMKMDVIQLQPVMEKLGIKDRSQRMTLESSGGLML